MTMLRKLGQLGTHTKPSQWVSQSLRKLSKDNLYDSLSARYTKALARAMAYTKQVKAAAILNNAFASGTTHTVMDKPCVLLLTP